MPATPAPSSSAKALFTCPEAECAEEFRLWSRMAGHLKESHEYDDAKIAKEEAAQRRCRPNWGWVASNKCTKEEIADDLPQSSTAPRRGRPPGRKEEMVRDFYCLACKFTNSVWREVAKHMEKEHSFEEERIEGVRALQMGKEGRALEKVLKVEPGTDGEEDAILDQINKQLEEEDEDSEEEEDEEEEEDDEFDGEEMLATFDDIGSEEDENDDEDYSTKRQARRRLARRRVLTEKMMKVHPEMPIGEDKAIYDKFFKCAADGCYFFSKCWSIVGGHMQAAHEWTQEQVDDNEITQRMGRRNKNWLKRRGVLSIRELMKERSDKYKEAYDKEFVCAVEDCKYRHLLWREVAKHLTKDHNWTEDQIANAGQNVKKVRKQTRYLRKRGRKPKYMVRTHSVGRRIIFSCPEKECQFSSKLWVMVCRHLLTEHAYTSEQIDDVEARLMADREAVRIRAAARMMPRRRRVIPQRSALPATKVEAETGDEAEKAAAGVAGEEGDPDAPPVKRKRGRPPKSAQLVEEDVPENFICTEPGCAFQHAQWPEVETHLISVHSFNNMQARQVYTEQRKRRTPLTRGANREFDCPECAYKHKMWYPIAMHLSDQHGYGWQDIDDAEIEQRRGRRNNAWLKRHGVATVSQLMRIQGGDELDSSLSPAFVKPFNCPEEGCGFNNRMWCHLRTHLYNVHGYSEAVIDDVELEQRKGRRNRNWVKKRLSNLLPEINLTQKDLDSNAIKEAAEAAMDSSPAASKIMRIVDEFPIKTGQSVLVECPTGCGTFVRSRIDLAAHAAQEHASPDYPREFDIHTQSFENDEDFKMFKEDLELRHISYFTTVNSYRSSDARHTTYVCHRACKGEKRRQTKNERKKKQKNCTAFIQVRRDEQTHRITAQYCTGHIGHERDASLLPISESQRMLISERVLKEYANASVERIAQMIRMEHPEPTSRLHYLTGQELYNAIRHPKKGRGETAMQENIFAHLKAMGMKKGRRVGGAEVLKEYDDGYIQRLPPKRPSQTMPRHHFGAVPRKRTRKMMEHDELPHEKMMDMGESGDELDVDGDDFYMGDELEDEEEEEEIVEEAVDLMDPHGTPGMEEEVVGEIVDEEAVDVSWNPKMDEVGDIAITHTVARKHRLDSHIDNICEDMMRKNDINGLREYVKEMEELSRKYGIRVHQARPPPSHMM